MNLGEMRKKIKNLVSRRDRQTRLWKKTGLAGHGKKAKELTKEIKPLKQKLKNSVTPKPISDKGIDFIADFEGFYSKPYNDPVGYATVGYGHLLGYRPVLPADKKGIWVKGQKVRGQLSQKEAKILLRNKLRSKYEPTVKGLFSFGGPLYGKFTQNRYDALVSFAFNLGPASLTGVSGFETIGKAIKSGNLKQIGDAMLLYDKAGGNALPGLTRRRKAERRLFLDGNYSTEV